MAWNGLKNIKTLDWSTELWLSIKRCPQKQTYVCVSGGKKFSFWENLACFVFLWSPFWGSTFCLITDELLIFIFLSISIKNISERSNCPQALYRLAACKNSKQVLRKHLWRRPFLVGLRHRYPGNTWMFKNTSKRIILSRASRTPIIIILFF